MLTFFGFMHGEQIGIGESPVMALSYLGVAGYLFACAKLGTVTAVVPMDLEAEPLPAAE